MLEVKDLHVSYGGIRALRGVDIEVPDGKIVTLIGANGAGKSTLLRTISGLVKAESGSITYNGKEILGMSINKILELGIAQVPEGRRVFTNLTVLENLRIGAYLRRDRDGIQKDIDWVYELFPRLQERSWQMAGTLSGGEQQMLAVGRALMSRPKLMMMDEPSLGLAPLVDHPRDQPPGRHRPAHRAECQHGPENRRPGLRPRDRHHHPPRHRRRAADQRSRQTRLPRRIKN